MKMKNIKLILLGIAALLYGVCAILLSGLEGLPTYHNGFYEMTGIIFPAMGMVFSIIGCVRRDDVDNKKR